MPNNQRGFVHIAVIVILLLGLALGVYLIGQKTNIFSRASSGPVSGPVSPTPSSLILTVPTSDITTGTSVPVSWVFPGATNQSWVALYNTTGSRYNWVWLNTCKNGTFGSNPKTSGNCNLGFPNNIPDGNYVVKLFKVDGSDSASNIADEKEVVIDRSPPSSTTRTKYLVKPYLVYPADKPMYPEYEQAVNSYLIELQNWYLDKVGKTFTLAPLQIIRTPENYLTLRCGDNPSEECRNNPSALVGNTPMYINKAIHNGQERWDEQTVALVFSVGAGGYAGGRLNSGDAGFAIVGDFVLEPISGKANDWGIPCKYATWQCELKNARGTVAHELTHGFGLGHPFISSPDMWTIMRQPSVYPEVGFLPFETDFLKQSPFFNPVNE